MLSSQKAAAIFIGLRKLLAKIGHALVLHAGEPLGVLAR
jgi:hypothetical protein